MTATVLIVLSLISTFGCRSSEPGTGSAAADSTSVESTGASGAKATGPGNSGAGGVANTPESRQRMVLLGTSLTAGLGLSPDDAYPALLQKKMDSAGYPMDIVGAGLSGETSAGALRRAAWVLDQPVSMVVLEVGANDGLRGVDPDSTKANLLALINAVHREQPNARVLLVQMEAPTNLGKRYTTRFHNIYGEVAQETGTTLLPFLLDGVAGVAALNQSDGIHPNADGSVRVAETMWRALGPIVASVAPTPR